MGSTSANGSGTGDERVVQDGMLVGDAGRFICVLEQPPEPRSHLAVLNLKRGSEAIKPRCVLLS